MNTSAKEEAGTAALHFGHGFHSFSIFSYSDKSGMLIHLSLTVWAAIFGCL